MLRTGPLRSRPAVALLAAAVFAMAAFQARAQEAIDQEEPTPSSVRQSLTIIERTFRPPPPPPAPLFPQLREQLKEAPPFFRDAQVDVNLRTYYRKKINSDSSINEAWAGGGSVSVKSGYVLDMLSVGTAFYTSQPLYAPADRDGTDLLAEGQHGYATLGQLHARAKIVPNNFITAGRAIYDTPFIGRDDGKMSPNTFEAYVLQGTAGDGNWGLRYGGGYFTKIKEKNSDTFISMSKSAGADADRGVAALGALYTYGSISLGAIDYYSKDTINIWYSEAKYATSLPAGFDAMLAAQFIDQRSVGDDLLIGAPFATNQFGLRGEIGRDGAILALAYSTVGSGYKLQNPWSGNPGYTSTIVAGFKNQGEQAAIAKLSYDFTRVGLAGVTAYTLYGRGWSNAAALSAPLKEDELDFDLQWRPRWDALKGLWLRARLGLSKVDQGGNQSRLQDFRLIANYDFSLF